MIAPVDRIPVFLLTGFLGSGKTTLLNALLKAPDFANTAVIVNEFGEIGLDHFLIERSQDNVVLLDAGCLCCTISDALHETLADLYARRVRGEVPAFERVVIETTGLAEPAPILHTLLGHSLVVPHYRLEATVVTVDAQHIRQLLVTQPEAGHQIAVADRLLITKTDLAPFDDALLQRLRSINRFATVMESVAGACAVQAFAGMGLHHVPTAQSISDEPTTRRADTAHGHHVAQEYSDARGGHRNHDHKDAHKVDHRHAHDRNRHDAHIRAHCLIIDDPLSWSGIAAWWQWMVDMLGDRLLRCKGLLRISETDELVFIQGVQRVFHKPERLPDWPDGDHRSRLVCITRDTAESDILTTLAALQIEAGTDPRAALAELRRETTTTER